MQNLAIVAIPTADDPVWRYSSEEVPHLTILYLGDQPDSLDTSRMEEFIEHVVNTSMYRFGMSVDERGKLGDKDADVLFFNKEYCSTMLTNSRSYFLADPEIKRAYDSTEQYSSWVPHLTMGYPATPAKVDDRDYPGISWINFDRIAFWTGDYEGPEYKLKSNSGAVSMSAASSKNLQHYGIKGMKWGVSRDTIGSIAGVAKKFAPVATAGLNALGKKYTPDETKSQYSQKVGEVGGLHRVSDKDLQAMLSRMNMERQYKSFMEDEAKSRSAGQTATFKFLQEAGKLAIPLIVGGPVAAATSPGAFKAYSSVANKFLNRSGTLSED